MEQIISLAVAEGLWAVLFCVLFFYELRDSRKREDKYNQIIDALDGKLDIVSAVKSDTADIKDDTDKIKSETQAISVKLSCVRDGEASV